jgi:hypothetical protein
LQQAVDKHSKKEFKKWCISKNVWPILFYQGFSIKNKHSDSNTTKGGCNILEAKVPLAISSGKLGQNQHLQLLNLYFLENTIFS